jgi:hypothetical protein
VRCFHCPLCLFDILSPGLDDPLVASRPGPLDGCIGLVRPCGFFGFGLLGLGAEESIPKDKYRETQDYGKNFKNHEDLTMFLMLSNYCELQGVEDDGGGYCDGYLHLWTTRDGYRHLYFKYDGRIHETWSVICDVPYLINAWTPFV